MKDIYDKYWNLLREGNIGLHKNIEAAISGLGNPTSIKCAMNMKGLPAGSLRLPLVDAKPEAQETIRKALATCGL